MKKIVVGTHNNHKVVEIAALLDLPGWELVPIKDQIGNMTIDLPSENATTFTGNARIKARFAHDLTGCAALADDSGLVVDALNGEPGIYSARYAGEGATAATNNAKLLAALEGIEHKDRTARFVCALVFIDTDGTELVVEGTCEGHIADAPRGNRGFGYDPLFIPLDPEGNPGSRTLGEYSVAQKNAISHRAKAVAELRRQIAQIKPATTGEKVRIVAFDYDGTLIDVASPVRLVNRLVLDRIMSVKALTKIGVWGARYKMGAELDQSVPRNYIFGSFTNFPSTDANGIMVNLYNEELRYHIRAEALERFKAHKDAGELVILVSASFDPILKEVTREIGADGYIATQMEVKDGYYTGRTIGNPPEGEQKLIQLTEYADTRFGEGNWELTWAYGDHFSDVPLLSAAQNATVVEPDRRLAITARKNDWEVVAWSM